MTTVERRPGLPLHPAALDIDIDLDTLVEPAYGVR
jgi:hypothetical protein